MTRKERQLGKKKSVKKKCQKTEIEEKDEFFSIRKCERWELLLGSCKRGCGPTVCTPVISWKEVGGFQNTIIKGNNPFLLYYSSFSQVQISARKLASALWKFHHYFSNSEIMYLGLNNNHQRRRNHHHRISKDEGFDVHPSLLVDPHRGGSPDHQPSSAGSLRRHIAASLMRHHQSAERNKHALQPLSPASYGSSLEMAPYNRAATPDSSIELRGRMGEPSYSFKTSTELLKVLNRIWTLEEQHASNVSLVKALKTELDHARKRIKELLRDQQGSRHEIDELMKQLSQDSFARKSKDHERLEAALQSVRDELEDERKLRKRSESLHRKLARELFEIKVALSTTVKELENERKSSEILENLCDEFAKSTREYAKQVQDHDNLILHVSESWLDERAQKKDREAQKASIVDKLRPEIEMFLTARQTANVDTKSIEHKETRLRRHSLESIPEVGTAPDDSAFSNAHAEISKADSSHYDEQEEIIRDGTRKVQSPHSELMSEHQNTPRETDPRKTSEGTPTEITMLQKSDMYDSYQKKSYNEDGHESNSKTVDKLISELLVSEGGSLPPGHEAASSNPSALRRHVSPVRQWMTSMKSFGPKISELSSRTHSARENSLKAKLQEPKSKGQRSRLKILKGSS